MNTNQQHKYEGEAYGGRALENLDDDLLLGLARSDLSSASLIEAIIFELSGRDIADGDELNRLFVEFVHKGMDELFSRYQSLDEVTWGSDLEEAREDLVSHVKSWTETGVDSAGAEPDWPWPIDEPPEGPGGQSTPQFEQQYSGLRLCGYHVGKTHGMPDNERRRFLDQFFRNDLPSVVEKYHGDEYGDPGSETRLRKMANVIAAHCRNSRRFI